jgi:stearoyl-CoA desaturase (delta-9 desaturase)
MDRPPGPVWLSTERVSVLPDTCPITGRIVWDPAKSVWLFSMMILALVGAPLTVSVSGVAVFLVTTAITICAGHSVGMHRLLIHHAFQSPRWLECLLIWLGTLVGMAGPFGMMRAHDLRDWHQRQRQCPDHPAHRAGFWRDAWWQLHCRYALTRPPVFVIEPRRADDPFLRFLEATWMVQQLPLAVVLYAFGGWAWVIWGIPVRVSVSLIGHWAIGHYSHRQGHQGWVIDGLPVQGYNLPRFAWLTFGESWHGNHHAFPHSALLGAEAGQADPGFWFVRVLEVLGMATEVRLPESEPPRKGLKRAG